MKTVLNTRNLLVGLFLTALIFATVDSVSAQRAKRARRAVETAAQNKTDLRKGAEDVAIQIKNVTKFLYVLGGVVRGIEDIDKDVRAGRATAEVARKNEEFKVSVRSSIQGIRTGLVNLENDFQTKPALRKYLFTLQPINSQSLRAQDFARADRFRDSGTELLLVIETLSDTLVEMP